MSPHLLAGASLQISSDHIFHSIFCNDVKSQNAFGFITSSNNYKHFGPNYLYIPFSPCFKLTQISFLCNIGTAVWTLVFWHIFSMLPYYVCFHVTTLSKSGVANVTFVWFFTY